MVDLRDMGMTFRTRARQVCPPAFAHQLPTPAPLPDVRSAAGRPVV